MPFITKVKRLFQSQENRLFESQRQRDIIVTTNRIRRMIEANI